MLFLADVSEPVIDPGSAAAALQKALSALGRNSAYTSTDTHTTQSGYGSGYADPSELRAGTAGPGSSGTDSFYEAYIIRPTAVVERSTIDSRARQGNHATSPLSRSNFCLDLICLAFQKSFRF